MITPGMIVVHRNLATPFPMYFYTLEEHNDPTDEEFPGHPGFWYGLYVLPDFLALQVRAGWQHFCPVVTESGRQFAIDVSLPMYVSLHEQNIVETFVISPRGCEAIHAQKITFLLGDEDEYNPSDQEMAFVNHPEYLAAFKLTKHAQGLEV